MTSKLSEICDFVYEKVKIANLSERTYISTENMLPNRGGIKKATTLPAGESTQAFCKQDILVSNIRPYFKKIWQATFDGGCSNDVLVFRAKKNIDAVYLYYILSNDSFFEYATSTAKGTKMPRGDKFAIMNYTIPSVEIKKQSAIAMILRGIDKKIKLNSAINDNLLQQAKSVFFDWFVAFTPFTDEDFVISPIGTEIPQSLQMQQIASIPHVLETGRRPKGGAASSGIPSVGAENVKQLGQFDFSSNKFIPIDFAAKQKSGKITGYELLLYKDGGKPGTFIPHFSMFGEGFPYNEFFVNEHIFKLDFFDHGKNEFAYFYMQTDYATSWLANNGGKAAIPGINRQDVRAIWIYDLNHPQVKCFSEWVQPIFKTIFCNCYENMQLTTLRDTLLPKLMSGELDVSSIQL